MKHTHLHADKMPLLSRVEEILPTGRPQIGCPAAPKQNGGKDCTSSRTGRYSKMYAVIIGRREFNRHID